MKSNPIRLCDLCGEPLKRGASYFDAKTALGPWAWMCCHCATDQQIKLGIGKGQQFRSSDDVKIAG